MELAFRSAVVPVMPCLLWMFFFPDVWCWDKDLERSLYPLLGLATIARSTTKRCMQKRMPMHCAPCLYTESPSNRLELKKIQPQEKSVVVDRPLRQCAPQRKGAGRTPPSVVSKTHTPRQKTFLPSFFLGVFATLFHKMEA